MSRGKCATLVWSNHLLLARLVNRTNWKASPGNVNIGPTTILSEHMLCHLEFWLSSKIKSRTQTAMSALNTMNISEHNYRLTDCRGRLTCVCIMCGKCTRLTTATAPQLLLVLLLLLLLLAMALPWWQHHKHCRAYYYYYYYYYYFWRCLSFWPYLAPINGSRVIVLTNRHTYTPVNGCYWTENLEFQRC